MNKFLFALILMSMFCAATTQTSYSKNVSLLSDTTIVRFEATSGEVALINDNKPIVVRRGDVLVIDIGKVQNPIQVRVHSSLGRLLKHFKDVVQPVSMPTDNLEPGIYIVVIKKLESREIKKVLVTEP